MTRTSFRDRVAALFRAHPGQWIDAGALQAVGGRFASRTRISQCRTDLGMRIENRTHYEYRHEFTCPATQAWDIPEACQCLKVRVTISEYMFVPDPAPASDPIGHDLNVWGLS